MRPKAHSPVGTRDSEGRLRRRGDRDASVAVALLGAAHPLSIVLRRLDTVVEQSVSVAAAQLVAGVLLYRGAPFAPALAIAAAVVQIVLALQMAVLVQSRRDRCRELIIGGESRLALRAVDVERRRLEDPRLLARLARTLDDMADTARRSLPRHPASRPLFDVRVIRAVEPQLREIAALLRTDAPCVRGAALVERVLTCGDSPLYGADAEPLRWELRRASYLLAR
jgi:hypothetical protein